MATAEEKLARQVWEECFYYFDMDRDGKLKKDEVLEAARSNGMYVTPETLDEVAPTEDALVDKQTYMRAMEKWSTTKIKHEDVVEAFRVFDRDGKGLIRTPELRQVMCTIGQKLDDDEIDALLEIADPEETGQVNYEEMVQKAQAKVALK